MSSIWQNSLRDILSSANRLMMAHPNGVIGFFFGKIYHLRGSTFLEIVKSVVDCYNFLWEETYHAFILLRIQSEFNSNIPFSERY